MRRTVLFLSIIAPTALHPHLLSSQVSNATPLPSAPEPQSAPKPDISAIPRATPLPPEKAPEPVTWDADTQSKHGSVYFLGSDPRTGKQVEVTSGDHLLRADTITYNEDTHEATATGHVRLTGGENGEYINATHGTYNLQTQTGRFYDASGSVNTHGPAPAIAHGASSSNGLSGTTTPAAVGRSGLVNSNPFLFWGKVVVKTGPQSYDIYDGSVTSCLLPNPDWLLSSGHLAVTSEQARAGATVFHLLGLPLFFLPYATHPVNTESRQSGILIPEVGQSNTNGWTIGEQYYVTLGRSADFTVGLIYYSLRGWSQSATFRAKGAGEDFFQSHFSALQDRGYYSGGVYVNQGGEDVTAAFRKQLTDTTRFVGDAEYLSSYIYREAFTNNFNQAVSSDITSIGYLINQNDGVSMDVLADRYQGLKRVATTTEPGEEVHILHVPSLDFTSIDRPIANLFGDIPLLFNLTGSIAGLKRVEPDFTSSGVIERLDLRPELALPFSGDGWHFLASVAGRETFYSRSRVTPYPPAAPPIESTEPVNRADVDFQLAIRPPAVERTFEVPESLQNFLGTEVRHTIEPEITYRVARGVDNFLSILRFDENDVVADTNQLEYGVTQHLYFRPKPKPVKPKPGCPTTPAQSTASVQLSQANTPPALPDVMNPTPSTSTDANGIPDASAQAPQEPFRTHAKSDPCNQPAVPTQQEWFSWRLTQRVFFDPTFGGAVITGRRNIFDSTLDLSGVAFLTGPRNISPLLSRARFRTSGHTDVEWDFDYDTGAKKFTSSNVYLDGRRGNLFGGISYALLSAPGRFSELIDNGSTVVSSPISNFKQMRALGGFGDPNKPGLAIAASAGIDIILDQIQYATIQATYNWNCCGLTVEYRKYELGSVRNENAYRFNFTLANIGGAGNIRHADRLF
jgi:LPS-assembly protein